MGFEVKIVVGKSTDTIKGMGDDADKNWFQIMGMVDICKPGHGSELAKLCGNIAQDIDAPNVYLYAPMGDGDMTVTEDCYGTKLQAFPLSMVLDALYADSNNDSYRRFKWALALLESMQDDIENLEVVLYGY